MNFGPKPALGIVQYVSMYTRLTTKDVHSAIIQSSVTGDSGESYWESLLLPGWVVKAL